MPGESQETLFARIKDALADKDRSAELPDDLEISRVIGSDADVVETFTARAIEAGMYVHHAADTSAMIDKVLELIDQIGAKSALVPADELPGRNDLVGRLADEFRQCLLSGV